MKRMLCLLLALFPLLLTLTLLGIALLAGMRYLHAWLPVLLLSQLLDAFFVWKHRWKGADGVCPHRLSAAAARR